MSSKTEKYLFLQTTDCDVYEKCPTFVFQKEIEGLSFYNYPILGLQLPYKFLKSPQSTPGWKYPSSKSPFDENPMKMKLA